MNRSIYLQQKAYKYIDLSTYIPTGHKFLFITGWMLYSMLDSLNQGHMAPRGRGPHWSMGQETAHGHLALARKQPWTAMTWQA